MSKKIKYLFVISILVLSLLVLPFTVSAESALSFNVDLSPIYPNDSVRYIEVLSKDADGNYFVTVFQFFVYYSTLDNSIYQSSVGLSSSLSLDGNTIYIERASGIVSDFDYFCYCYGYDSDGEIYFEDNVLLNEDSIHLYFGNGIYGIHYYGFAVDHHNDFPSNPVPFVVYYANNDTFSNYLPGIAQDTGEILEYLRSLLESNEQFYDDLDNYFQDDNWSLLTDISEELYTLRGYFDPSYQNNLYDYLVSMSQDSSDILYYLSTFNDYFQGADWSLLEDLHSSLFAISQDTENIWFSLSDFYDSFISFEGTLYSYLDLFLEEGFGNPEYDPPSDVSPPRDDSTIQDIEDAEQEALGGMTQEEVKEQVDEVLDSSSEAEEIGATEINVNNIAVVNNLFTDMFGVFGGAWSTFFLLNLTIAFAAFLIGRRY